MIFDTLQEKLVAGAFVLIIAAMIFGAGFLTDRIYFSNYKGEVKGAAEARVAETKAADIKNEGDYHASSQDIAKALKNQADYYRAHPVVKWVQNDGGCAVPGTAGDSKRGHDSTSSADAATYLSPYRPDETEQVAARLDNLQQRLLKAGVDVR